MTIDSTEAVEKLDLEDDFEIEPEYNNNENPKCYNDNRPMQYALDPEAPQLGSPEWTDWFLDQLTEEEKINGCPKADGLLRGARLLFGEFDMGVKVHIVVHDYAAVTCHIVAPGGTQFVGSAECNAGNTDLPYNKYPLATAETRAIGRALKKMLCLTNVLTAEETSKAADLTVPANDENRTEGSITETQIKFIDRNCKKHNIGVEFIVEVAVGSHDSIKDLSHAEALKVQELLNEWSKEAPSEKKSYDDTWKTRFN